MTEEAGAKAASARRTLVLLAVFSAGFLLVFGGAVLYVRHASAPRPGIVLWLEVAPTGSATLVFTNQGEEPLPLLLPDRGRAGPEVDVLVDEGQAERREGPIMHVGQSETVLLGPGESVAQDLPLAEYLVLKGRATIHVERAKLSRTQPRLRSNSVTVGERP